MSNADKDSTNVSAESLSNVHGEKEDIEESSQPLVVEEQGSLEEHVVGVGAFLDPSSKSAQSSKRLTKLTPKALQNKLDETLRQFNKRSKVLYSSIDKLTRVIITTKETDNIREASSLMYKTFDSLEESIDILREHAEPHDIEKVEDTFSRSRLEVNNAAERARLAIDNLTAELVRSDASSSSHSRKSKAKSKSASSHRSESTVGSRASVLQKIERAASLRAQLPYLEDQTKLQKEMERVSMEREIAALEAGAKVYREAELKESYGICEEQLSLLPTESKEDKCQRVLDSITNPVCVSPSKAASESPRVHFYNNLGDEEQAKKEDGAVEPPNATHVGPLNREPISVTTTCNKPVSSLSMPSISFRIPDVKIDLFGGDVVEFPSWEIAFDAIIDSQVESTDLKINLLSQHLTGEAKTAVSGLLTNRSEGSYLTARKRLKERYGNPNILSQAFLNKLEDWPPIKSHQPKELQIFSDLLTQIAELRKTIGGLQILDFPQESRKILSKLPMFFENEWREVVCSWRDKNGISAYPPFDRLVAFIERRALRANIPELQSNLKTNAAVRWKTGQQDKKNAGGVRSFKTNASNNTAKHDEGTIKCSYCLQEHHINECTDFSELSQEQCLNFLKENKLCFGCGSSANHLSRNCQHRSKCLTCGKAHLTALHFDKPENESSVRCTEVCSLQDQNGGSDNSMIVPVWVRSQSNTDKEILVYCILDDQSNTCFISNKLRQQLGLSGYDTTLTLSTMHKNQSFVSCKKVVDLEISSFDHKTRITIPSVFTRDHIPASRSQIPKPEIAKQWDHLAEIADKIYPYQPEADVAILIGNNVPNAVRPREIIAGTDDQPYAQRTVLGWGVIGIVCHSQADTCAISHRISAFEKETTFLPEKKMKPGEARFVFATKAKELFDPAQVKKMFEIDFVERKDENCELSVEDRKFVKLLSERIKKTEDGHFVMPLPLKSGYSTLPNNRPLALKRLWQLKRRFLKDANFKKDYIEYMDEVLTKWAEKVPDEDARLSNRKVNYVPHTGVYHPRKPGKIRVVFDCSATYGGVSLNDYLLSGPNLMNGMVGVLCRFRKDDVAVIADIQSMFCQFYVEERDRDFLRFLWWEDGDFTRPVVEYRMVVHLFGAVSSPGCANFGLKSAADNGEEEFGQDVADFIRNDFYMDDGLISLPSIEEANSLIERSRALCAAAGLRLHKFVSNKREVLDNVPESERAKSLKELDLRVDPLPFERALGIIWCIEKDVFKFRIELRDSPMTRRGMLSTISSIYDPLGFLAPVLLEGKRVLQDLCRENAKWDDPIPEQLNVRWRRWRSNLISLDKFEVPRCMKPNQFGPIEKIEMHHFSDASENGYGQCSYLKMINRTGNIHCSLVMGKARVTPLKHVTIPRLELNAALVSAKISNFLKKELKYPHVEEHFWVDSKIVLGYLNNEAKRFNVYVANRVQQIRDLSDSHLWHHVTSKTNPSDIASRGIEATRFFSDPTWLFGPSFLWENTNIVQENDYCLDEETSLELRKEMRKATTFNTTVLSAPIFDVDRLQHLSSWFRAKRAVANCILWKRKLIKLRLHDLESQSQSGLSTKCLHSEDLVVAEIVIIQGVQFKYFGEEIAILQNQSETSDNRESHRKKDHKLKSVSSLYRLDPFLDCNGVLRVGGRIRRADLTEALCHPVILPKKSHITKLVINHFHQRVNHMGRGTTHSNLRQNGFWIINGSSAVSQMISQCVPCKRLRGNLQTQKMADLPVDRLTEEPPFTYTAVDFFGPFCIKEKRSVLKRYGVVFLCMSCRAVHLESANSLETDSFINALRRFLARRGPVRQIRSDCGTNIVGAKNELRKALTEMDKARVKDYLLKNDCNWVEFQFNTPRSSHMAGSWERQIRTIRNALEPLLLKTGTHLDDESFRTFITEVENIMNSRPLSIENICDPTSLEPLTPSHLLTMKPKLLLPPPGRFVKADLYARKRWRRVQYLANIFWNRWRKEILHKLQVRQKWTSPRRNLKIGDIVTLCDDDDLPRNKWKLAKIESVYPSEDGFVRKVKLRIADSNLDRNGKRTKSVTFLDRPIHKLVLLITVEENNQEFDE